MSPYVILNAISIISISFQKAIREKIPLQKSRGRRELIDCFKKGIGLLGLDEFDDLFDANFGLLAAEADGDDIAFLYIGGSFGHLIVDGDPPAVAGFGGNGAPLDQAANF